MKNQLILIYLIMFFFSSLNERYDIIMCVYWFELFSQVSNVAHGPLVILQQLYSRLGNKTLITWLHGEQSTCCPKVLAEALGNCCPRPSASGNSFPYLGTTDWLFPLKPSNQCKLFTGLVRPLIEGASVEQLAVRDIKRGKQFCFISLTGLKAEIGFSDCLHRLKSLFYLP